MASVLILIFLLILILPEEIKRKSKIKSPYQNEDWSER